MSFSNAFQKLQMTSPIVQKKICCVIAIETSNAIIKDTDDSYFVILIDQSHDVATKEQMAIVVRYVDKNGHVIKRFLGFKHATSTTIISIKTVLSQVYVLFGDHIILHCLVQVYVLLFS